jgi:hypothetical protein
MIAASLRALIPHDYREAALFSTPSKIILSRAKVDRHVISPSLPDCPELKEIVDVCGPLDWPVTVVLIRVFSTARTAP